MVLLLIVLTLVIIELYKTFKWGELDQVFVDVLLMVISFYFWQKGMVYDDVDSLVKSDLSYEDDE